jgi:predicted ATP-dependent serine protease
VGLLFIEEDKVVGIESTRDELISWLVGGVSKHSVISVVGIGGIGKTTLTKKVYENESMSDILIAVFGSLCLSHTTCPRYSCPLQSKSTRKKKLLRGK